jgi:hypothetical protein
MEVSDMGAAKDVPRMQGQERESGPPSSRSRPVLKLENQTDPSLPPPDPNRTLPIRENDTNPLMPPPDANRRRQARRPPEAGPDALDTPEYVAPTPPPAETEHKTFEVQTVKIMEEDRRRQEYAEPGMQQADIPTAPSTRIQRRRSWTMAVVLIALGVTAGLGLFALAHLTRVEPMKPGTPSAIEPAAPPPTATAPDKGASAAGAPTAEATASTATPSTAAPAATPEATARVEATGKPPRKNPEAEATATAKGTSTVPLGPPEF